MLSPAQHVVNARARARRLSLAGYPDLFRTDRLPIPTALFAAARFAKVAEPVTFQTRIVVTGASPNGLIFELGNATTAFAIWLDGTNVNARAGDTGANAAVATFELGVSLPLTTFVVTVAVIPGRGAIRLWLNGVQRARATAVNGALPNGLAAASDGAFAAAASGALPADVTQTGAPANFQVVEPMSIYAGQRPRHFG